MPNEPMTPERARELAASQARLYATLFDEDQDAPEYLTRKDRARIAAYLRHCADLMERERKHDCATTWEETHCCECETTCQGRCMCDHGAGKGCLR